MNGNYIITEGSDLQARGAALPDQANPMFFKSIILYHNLEKGDTKSGQLEDWLVEKNNFHMHAIKKVKKGTYVEIQNDFQNMFNFYYSLYG